MSPKLQHFDRESKSANPNALSDLQRDLARLSIRRNSRSQTRFDTNRPSAAIGRHVTVDFYRTLCLADVDRVDAV